MGQAAAQNPPPEFNVQLFRPAMSGGMHQTNVGELSRHLAVNGALWSNYMRRPLRTELRDDGVPLGDIVDQRIELWGSAGIGLFDVAELRVLVPYVVSQSGLNTNIVRLAAGSEGLAASVLGDISADLRIGVLQQASSRPAIALRFAGVFPTGSPEDLAGEVDGAYEGTLIVSKTLGAHVLALEAGYLHRPEPMRVINFEVEDEILYRLGYRVRLGRRATTSGSMVVAEVAGRTRADRPFGASGGDLGTDISMEGRLGLRYRMSGSLGLLDIDVAGGLALSDGYGGSQPRVLVGVSYATSDPTADDDRDGFVNAYDECEDEPEDYDDFEDDDGCPEYDNDNDEIPDEDDECPNEPEDLDDTDDLDGCPDPEYPDSDDDGYDDNVDKCPNEPEDFDRFEDNDGCPDLDNDGDGLSDLSDLCPNEPEDKDGDRDDDGCPEDRKKKRERLVIYKRGALVFRQPLRFAPKTDDLAGGTIPIIEDLAKLLTNRPDAKVLIEVYAERPNRKGRRLAKQRAKKIASELVLLGIKKGRLKTRAARWKRSRRGEVTVTLNRARK